MLLSIYSVLSSIRVNLMCLELHMINADVWKLGKRVSQHVEFKIAMHVKKYFTCKLNMSVKGWAHLQLLYGFDWFTSVAKIVSY